MDSAEVRDCLQCPVSGALAKELNAVKRERDDLQSEIKHLNTENDDLKQEVAQLKAGSIRHQERVTRYIARLTTQLNDTRGELNEHTGQHPALKLPDGEI